ncbi:hypothetical protein [Metabacillus fastidiosus]|uniref:hypothetical protein n=1 Tax=Metabacillus fastidiosus TaxID=1458 RepID=UPI003D2D0EAE
MHCPNCGKQSVRSSQVDSQEQYYTNSYWKQTVHKCSECLASFINYNNGSEARRERDERELRDRMEYERLKAKYEQ